MKSGWGTYESPMFDQVRNLLSSILSCMMSSFSLSQQHRNYDHDATWNVFILNLHNIQHIATSVTYLTYRYLCVSVILQTVGDWKLNGSLWYWRQPLKQRSRWTTCTPSFPSYTTPSRFCKKYMTKTEYGVLLLFIPSHHRRVRSHNWLQEYNFRSSRYMVSIPWFGRHAVQTMWGYFPRRPVHGRRHIFLDE